MTDLSSNKPPIWFWIVSVLALIWNAMGVNAYLQQAYDTEAHRAQYTAEQLQAIAEQPSWYTAAFAIAVFAGVLGCIALLIRRKIAKPLFLLSLLAVLVQLYHNLIMTSAIKDAGTFAMIMSIMIPIIAILLIMLAKKAASKGWIK